MRTATFFAFVLLGSCQTGGSVPQDMPTKKSAFVSVSVKIEIKAAADKVWSRLTSPDGIRTLSQFTFDDGKGVSLAVVGDHAAGTLAGDHGTMIVSFAKAGEELRFIWEPDKGHYVCSIRFFLQSGTGGTTTLQLTDSYSDDQPNADETTESVRKEYRMRLPEFKLLAEK